MSTKKTVATTTRQWTEGEIEAREDSIALHLAFEKQKKVKLALTAMAETDPVPAKTDADAADDPAIWVNPVDANKSLIFGSNKKDGIATYDLSGKQIAYKSVGKVNNIDLTNGFTYQGKKISVLGGSNRTTQSIDLFTFDEQTGEITRVGRETMMRGTIDDVYGFCMAYDTITHNHYAIVNGKNGKVHQYMLVAKDDGIELLISRTFKLNSQPEGMVADNENGKLYVGEEGVGIWKLAINTSTIKKELIKTSTKAENPFISYDIEGLALLKQGKEGYLVASSQGNFTYAVFDRTGDNDYVTSFKIVDGAIDGVEETDGLEINTALKTAKYPMGVMAIQDGFNYDGSQLKSQNYKLVSVADLIAALNTN